MTAPERDALLQEMAVDVKGLTVAIKGNGTKGLAQRMDEVENEVRPSTAKILRKRSVDAAIIGVGLVGVNMLGRWQGWW